MAKQKNENVVVSEVSKNLIVQRNDIEVSVHVANDSIEVTPKGSCEWVFRSRDVSRDKVKLWKEVALAIVSAMEVLEKEVKIKDDSIPF